MKKLTLGFSPCPNDTFIFDALVNGRLDTTGFEFEPVLEDVQTLNEWAAEGKLDISKISYGAYARWSPHYHLLRSGGAMGYGVGPLLISAEPMAPGISLEALVENSLVAIPGKDTTAHFLLKSAFPNILHKKFIPFDEVEDFVLERKGPGVIIHENRFTYQQKGLHKLADLGAIWEEKTGNPIPLGGIIIRKDIDRNIAHVVNRLIHESLQYSRKLYPQLSDYIKRHSQEMSENVMRNHIELYVNDFSLDMGEKGKAAIQFMIGQMEEETPEPVFIQ